MLGFWPTSPRHELKEFVLLVLIHSLSRQYLYSKKPYDFIFFGNFVAFVTVMM